MTISYSLDDIIFLSKNQNGAVFQEEYTALNQKKYMAWSKVLADEVLRLRKELKTSQRPFISEDADMVITTISQDEQLKKQCDSLAGALREIKDGSKCKESCVNRNAVKGDEYLCNYCIAQGALAELVDKQEPTESN